MHRALIGLDNYINKPGEDLPDKQHLQPFVNSAVKLTTLLICSQILTTLVDKVLKNSHHFPVIL